MDADPPQRLAVGHLESNVATGLVDGKWWPGSNGTGTAGNSGSTREWLFIFDRPYTEAGPNPALERDILNNGLPVMWWLGVQRRGETNFIDGDEFLIIANHINSFEDVFRYTVPSAESNPDLIRESARRVGVFPNPYYAGQSEGSIMQGRFVTFTNLPQKATLRIYNIAGHLVRTLLKDEPSQFLAWDLMNENSRLVASGMYIVRVDMPEIGEVKVLKVAIIQEEVIR